MDDANSNIKRRREIRSNSSPGGDRMPRRLDAMLQYVSKHGADILVFFGCLLLYYVVIARRYFGPDTVIGGDTQLVWSVHYFVMESLIEYLQYPLWDPTTLGGYPSHLMTVNGWFQNFHPFQLPFFLIAAVVGRMFHIDSNYLLVFQKTIYLFSLNLVAVMLISREICERRLARLLPPLVYTLCSFQFFALRDNLLVEGLPPALFFVFGMLYHANRRTPYSLMVFLIFFALWIAGFSYAYLLSSAWWVGTLAFLILLFTPGLLADSFNCIGGLWAQRAPRFSLLLVLTLILIATTVVGVSLSASIGEIIRASGNGPVEYDVSSGGQFGPQSAFSVEVWTNFLAWAPFPDIHSNFLQFDRWNSGVHHRYLGMALMPLLVIAVLFGHQRRYAWPFMLTAFVATAFIAYGPENPLFAFLRDHIPPIRNTRPLAVLLPRDATLLVVFAAALGLDLLLCGDPRGADAPLWATTRHILVILVIVAGGLVLASALPALASIRHSLAHIAVYLGLSCLIILVLTHGIGADHQPAMVTALLAVTAMDLTLSAAAYAKLPYTWSPKVPPNALAMPSHKLGPMKPGDPPWMGGYRGMMHQVYNRGPYVGTRAWLVLATHPSWQPILQNWNATQHRMQAYPDFRFFTNGAYVPFDAIRDIDNVKSPTYVHGPEPRLIRVGDKYFLEYPDRRVPVETGIAGFVEHAQSAEANAALGANAVAFSGWAIDQKGGRGAHEVLIFVGDTLWGSIGTGGNRPDIVAGFGQSYARSGFEGVLAGVQPAEQKNIRAFVALSDGTARELQYSGGYPFTTGYGPGPERLRAAPPTIYLHDKNAISPNIPGGEEKLSWSVTKWTPNHYAVQLIAPSDGYLLNLENYNRYWKASVDGQQQGILRANFTMQAIKLAKGEHTVEWRYEPTLFKLGWLAFYVAFGAELVAFACSGLSNRSSVGSAPT
jgi:hypothetical protein